MRTNSSQLCCRCFTFIAGYIIACSCPAVGQDFLCAIIIIAVNDLQVLRTWRNKSSVLTIQDFITKLCVWQDGGYISRNVWLEIQEFVPQELLPVAGASAAPSFGTDEQPSGGRNHTGVNKGMKNVVMNFVQPLELRSNQVPVPL